MATTYSLIDSAGGKFKLVQNPWRIQTAMPIAAGTYNIVVRANDTLTGRQKDNTFTITIRDTTAGTTPVWTLSTSTAQVNEGQTATWLLARTGPPIVNPETIDIEFVGMQREDFTQDKDDYLFSLAAATPGLTYTNAAGGSGFSQGVNLGNFLESSNGPGGWGVTITQDDINQIKTQGFDHVRLPVRWDLYALRASPYTVNDTIWGLVDQIVAWCKTAGLNIIINDHHHDADVWDGAGYSTHNTYPNNNLYASYATEAPRAKAIWTQIAGRYKNEAISFLRFEIINEPNGQLVSSTLAQYHNEVLQIIRGSGGLNATRRVIVSVGYTWMQGSTNPPTLWDIANLQVPNDSYITVDFHYYEPGAVTNQASGANLAFPRSGKTLQQEKDEITSHFQQIKTWLTTHPGVGIRIGEWGSVPNFTEALGKSAWYSAVRDLVVGNGWEWTIWDLRGSFPIYSTSTGWNTQVIAAVIKSTGVRRLSFGPQFSGQLPIARTLVSDNTTEGDETVSVQIANPTNAGSISGPTSIGVLVKDTSVTGTTPPPSSGTNSVALPKVTWKVVGLDPEIPHGAQIAVSSMKKIGVDAWPTGVSVRTGTSTIEGVTGTYRRIMIAADNVVLDGWDLSGHGVDIVANNATIRNCLFNHGGQPEWGSWAIRDFKALIYSLSQYTGHTIEYNTMDGKKAAPGASAVIAFDFISTSVDTTHSIHTVRRNHIHHMPSDGIDIGAGLVEENYWHDNGYNYGAHVDGMEIVGSGGYGLKVRRNNIDARPNSEVAAILAVDGANYDPGGMNAAIRIYADGNNDAAGPRFRGPVEVFENVLRGGGNELMTFPYKDGATTLTTTEGYAWIHDNFFGGESPYGANCWITSADAGWPQSPPAKVYVTGNKLIDGTVLKDYNGLPPTDTGTGGGGTTPTGTVVNDYVPSAWAKAQGLVQPPFPVTGKDSSVPVGRQSSATLKAPLSGGQGITGSGSGGEFYINNVGLYEDYDFRGRRAVLNFTNTGPDNVIFRNCLFDNMYQTDVSYFGQDITRGTQFRSDCSFEWCSFLGSSSGGNGECLAGPLSVVNCYRCYFSGWRADWVNVGGGMMYECTLENGGNGNGVHYDVVNWADNSIAPFYYYRCYIMGGTAVYPNPAGGFNSCLKLSPTGGPGPTHELLFEENFAWFPGVTPGANPANNTWYWFQNVAGTGQFRFLNNWFDTLRDNFTTLFIGLPSGAQNFAMQDNYNLRTGAKWAGSLSDTTSTLAHPGALTVTLAQTLTTSTPTFSLPANSTFVEYQYRVKGQSRWLPKTVPPQITTGTAVSVGSDNEFRFRPVNFTSGRRVTGSWVYPALSTGGGTPVTAPVIQTTAAQTVQEGSVFSVQMTADKAVAWSLGTGNDAAKAWITPGGLLTMEKKVYATPQDANGDNVYTIPVVAINGAPPTGTLVGSEFVGHHDLGVSYYKNNGAWPAGWPDTNTFQDGFRFWDNWDGTGGRNGCTWADINTADGVYNWTHMDAIAGILAEMGVKPQNTLYTFGRTPLWTQATAAANTKPPDDLTKYDAFVTAIVTRYKGVIKCWGLWNEPNSTNFWTGTTAQLKTMVSRANAIIKGIDPTAIIVSPEYQGNGSGNLGSFIDAAPAGASFDVVGVHYYMMGTSPLDELTYISALKTMMTSKSIGSMPIWDTEWGWNPASASDTDAIAYNAKKFIMNTAKGIQKNFLYAYDHATINTMWRTDTGVQALAAAVENLASWVVGRKVSDLTINGTVYSAVVTGGGGYEAIMVFNHGGSSNFTITAGKYSQYRTPAGVVTAIAAGATTVPITNMPILIEAPATGLTSTKLINITVTQVSSGGGSGEHAATADYASRVAAVAGTAYPTAWRSAIDTFIKALDVTTNNVWSQLIWAYVGYNDSMAAAKQNLKSSAYPLVDESGEPPSFTRKTGFQGRCTNGWSGPAQGNATYTFTLGGAKAGPAQPDWTAAWVAGMSAMAVGIHYNSTGAIDGLQILNVSQSQDTRTTPMPAQEQLLGIDKAGGSASQNYRAGTAKASATFGGDYSWTNQPIWIGGYDPYGSGGGNLEFAFIANKVLTDAEWAVINTAWNTLLTTLKGLS